MDRRFMFMKIFWAQAVICPCPSNIFFSETAWPIKAKVHVEHPKDEGMKVCINGQGHMTKMASYLSSDTESINF